MRERKKTAVHGTLEMTYMAVKFNFQQVLQKTLFPTMNTLKDMAVLNIIKTDGKSAPEAKREDLELIQMRLKSTRILPFGLWINKDFAASHML